MGIERQKNLIESKEKTALKNLREEVEKRSTLPETMFFRQSSQEKLENWQERFTAGSLNLGLRQGYERFSPYKPAIEAVFREAGLPEELAYLGLVESYWNQDTQNTFELFRENALYYGLTVTDQVDERKNPILAARAVALYLADVYNQTFSWGEMPREEYRWGWTILAYNMAPKTAQAKFQEYEGDLEKLLAETDNIESGPYLFKFYGMISAASEFENQPPLEFESIEIIYPEKKPTEHTIQPGENPTKLAKNYGCTVTNLLAINNIADPARIQIGDTLLIPKQPNYIISYPDILGSLGITEDLAELNPHLSPEILSGEENLPETTIFLPPGYKEKFYGDFHDALAENPEEEIERREERLNEVLKI